MNSPVRLGVFSRCRLNPHRCFQSEALRLYFPVLETWVVWSVLLPHCSSQFICTQMWDHLLCLPPPCLESSLPRLPVSTPPTGLDECFFFISFVIGLPYSLIFCQFWLFFVFKLLLSFFWLCEEAQCVYLRLHLGRKEFILFFITEKNDLECSFNFS